MPHLLLQFEQEPGVVAVVSKREAHMREVLDLVGQLLDVHTPHSVRRDARASAHDRAIDASAKQARVPFGHGRQALGLRPDPEFACLTASPTRDAGRVTVS